MDPEELPTPAYVYDLDAVRAAHRRLRGALPGSTRVFYSLKANPHPAIVAALTAEGCAAEVSSPGELATATAAGVADVLYTGPAKRDADVRTALLAGVDLFSVDSPSGVAQLDRLSGEVGAAPRMLLRINDDRRAGRPGLAMTGSVSQFGVDVAQVVDEPEYFRARGPARNAGFHLYMGSNLPGTAALLEQFAKSIATARLLAERSGLPVEILDLGGGFGAPYARGGDLDELPGLVEGLEHLLDPAFPGWREGHPEVVFESGRYLTATAGTLYVRVLDVKRSQGQAVVLLESGINHLGGMSGLRRLPPIVPELVAAESSTVSGALIAGPLCTPLDTWGRGVSAPDLRQGDLVRVPNVGAYGLSASLVAFLGHPAPVEVVVDDGRVVEISQLRIYREKA